MSISYSQPTRWQARQAFCTFEPTKSLVLDQTALRHDARKRGRITAEQGRYDPFDVLHPGRLLEFHDQRAPGATDLVEIGALADGDLNRTVLERPLRRELGNER